MTDWTQPYEAKPETWGVFIKHALSCGAGVTIETMPKIHYTDGVVGDIQYLRRVLNGENLTYPLPKDCVPNRTLRIGRVLEICGRLRIPEPPEWPLTL
jgi:hypothetical protein